MLDLEVIVININKGLNIEIASRCRKLAEYSAFVAKANEFKRELKDIEKAIKEAVKYCQSHDILKEFMETHGTEVLSMLMTEWNWDEALAVRYEEGAEDKQLEIARNFKNMGVPIEQIAKGTGLSSDEIKKLQFNA